MRHFTFKHKLGFTMIELVMVIVVLGIIVSLALPRLALDHKQEASDSILSSIRYTQHLAINDDKHMRTNADWQKRFWQIQFAPCSDGTLFFRIGSDDNRDSTTTFAKTESAIDPNNGKYYYTANSGDCDASDVSPNIKIGRKYGVTAIAGTGGCNGLQHIGFDHLGRPHLSFSASATPDYSSYMSSQCTFTFTLSNGDSFAIKIEPETGYAYIDTQNNS